MDTISVKLIANEISIWENPWEIIKIILPAISVLIAAYYSFKLGLKKDRIFNQEKEIQRLQQVEDFLLYSINLLIPAAKKQSENLKNYVEKLKEEVNVVRNVGFAQELYLRNIDSINTADIFKIFITSKKDIVEQSSFILGKFNLSITLIRDVLENFDKSNLEFHIAEDEYLKEMTIIISSIWQSINKLIELHDKNRVMLNEEQFIKEASKLHINLKELSENKQIELGNVFISKKELIDKLLPLTEKYRIRVVHELISDYLISFRNFTTLRTDFIEKFDAYSDYLNSAHKMLKQLVDDYKKL